MIVPIFIGWLAADVAFVAFFVVAAIMRGEFEKEDQ